MPSGFGGHGTQPSEITTTTTTTITTTTEITTITAIIPTTIKIRSFPNPTNIPLAPCFKLANFDFVYKMGFIFQQV